MAFKHTFTITDEEVHQHLESLPNKSKHIQEILQKDYYQQQEESNQQQRYYAKHHQGINTIITMFGLAAFFIGLTLITTHTTYFYLGSFLSVEGFVSSIIGFIGIMENQRFLKQQSKQTREVMA